MNGGMSESDDDYAPVKSVRFSRMGFWNRLTRFAQLAKKVMKKAMSDATAAPKKTATKSTAAAKKAAAPLPNDENAAPVAATKPKKAAAPKVAKPAAMPLAAKTADQDNVTSDRPVEEVYQKKSLLEHILHRPDSYIGSTQEQVQGMWVHDGEAGMVFRQVKFVPGLYKIFDEILVNAADNKVRDSTMDKICVTIDKERGSISVMNNGRGIPIQIHATEKVWL